MAKSRRTFGKIRKLPNGRYQASYMGPDGRRRFAPTRFQTKLDAEAWLTDRNREISRGEWEAERTDKSTRAVLFGEYAKAWLAYRTLEDRTREQYASLLERHRLERRVDLPLE